MACPSIFNEEFFWSFRTGVSPLCGGFQLKYELQCELDLTHRGAVFDVCNLPVVAALTVDAIVGAVVRAKRINGVIENVEEVRSELCCESFVDLELLHHR